jgi:hypothetical protein
MRNPLRPFAVVVFGLTLAIAPAFANQQQTQDQQQQPPAQTQPAPATQASSTAQPCPQTQASSSSTTATPNSTAAANGTASQSTTAQPCAQTTNLKPGDPGYNAPVAQKDDPKVKQGSQQDVDAIGNRNVGKGVDFYSIEHEIALGKQLSQEVERTAKLVDDPVITEYVNRVGQNIVNNSDCKVPFTIKVIDTDQVNAFALPGGFFYVYTGLVIKAQEESELAGVMAHEIAHVCARHGTKNATKGDIVQLAMIPAMILLPGGWAGYGIYEGMQFAIPIGFLKFSRDDERQADYLGLQYMYKAGYDPNSYITFFERILADEKRQPGTIPKLFSDHPPTPERIEKSEKEIAEILPARETYVVTTSEFDSVHARLLAYERRKKPLNGKDSPTLRTKTEQQKNGGTTTDPNSTSGDDDSDRPVLKKRPDGSGNN